MQEERKNNFGIIRFMGAIMVIVGHMYVLAGQAAPMIMWNVIHGLGVAVFFCIGGYLIALSWLRQPNFRIYLIKRIFRIFPALIVCVLLTVFMAGPLVTNLSLREYYTSPLTWKYMLNCFLYINHELPGVFENNLWGNAVNGSLWCLPVEFLMYLVTPVYIMAGMKLSVKIQKYYFGIVSLLVILAGSIWTTWFYDTNFIFHGFSFVMQIIPYFFVGVFIAVCKLEKLLNTQKAIIVMMIAAGLSYLPAPLSYVGQYVCIPYVILSLALAEKPVFTAANKRDISYGMFLFSFIIQQILIQVFVSSGYPLNVWILLTLTIVFSVLMGLFTEKFVENPSKKLCKKIVLLTTCPATGQQK